jgi:hypothetical protein
VKFLRSVRVSFEGGPTIQNVTNLRVAFDVKKSDGETMNSAIITIYNMNSAGRYALSTPRPFNSALVGTVIKCLLYAGYEGDEQELIAGDIFHAFSTKVGPDWITTIEIYSGILAASSSNVNFGLDGKTSALNVVKKLTAPLGIDVEYTAAAKTILQSKTLFDFSESGMPLRSTNRFLNSFGLEFTIDDDNHGLVYKIGTSRDVDAVSGGENTFHVQTGLIGTPKINRTGVDIVALLRPSISLMQKVFIVSKTISQHLQKDEALKNEYYVKGLRHYGDTHDDEWFTALECYYADLNPGVYT